MKKMLVGIALAAMSLPAHAAVDIFVTPGSASYEGPPVLENFDGATAPRWSRAIFTGSQDPVRAQPFGSTGGYASVGPFDGTPGVFDLSGLGPLRTISFVWGSVDTFNTLEFLGAGDTVLATVVGSQIFDPANGDQSNPNTNPLVTFTVQDSIYGQVTALRFRSTQNAFEFDNLAVAVPEPSTWAMMIGGFGLLGAAVRRSRRAAAVYA
jgi:hypothetical protein